MTIEQINDLCCNLCTAVIARKLINDKEHDYKVVSVDWRTGKATFQQADSCR